MGKTTRNSTTGLIRPSGAEYQTFLTEVIDAGESIWLSQK